MSKNILEQAFDLGFAKFLKSQYIRVAQPDLPMRNKPKQIVDRILLSKTRNYAFELKKTQGKSIPFSRIPDHQIKFLQNFEKSAGEAFLLCSFLELELVKLIPIVDFLQIQTTIPKKSFNFHDIASMQTLPVCLNRTRKYLDLSQFWGGT